MTASFFEGFTLLTFKNPSFLSSYPQNLQIALRRIFLLRRNMVQFNPQCSQYDTDLTYTLKPGQCVHSDYEFSNHYQINSAGTRDDEASLKRPEVIFLGDSYTMGWGVEQNETFSKIIEQKIGKRTLNGGISSYGTVRELKLLNRLDTSNLKLLVIQYHQNDTDENAFFRSHNRQLRVSSKRYYDQAKIFRTKYYFGKHTHILLSELWRTFLSTLPLYQPRVSLDIRQTAYDFLYALKYAPSLDLSSVKILVLGIDKKFFVELKNLIEQIEFSNFKDLSFIDMGLPPENYYFLDTHMNAKGHAVLADRILSWMSESISKRKAPILGL